MLFLAVLNVVFGWSILTTPEGFTHINLVLSQTAWAWWWIGMAPVNLVGAFVARDRMFFALSGFLKTAWAAAWLGAYFEGFPRAWVSAAIWGSFAAVVLLISTWPEVHTFRPQGGKRG